MLQNSLTNGNWFVRYSQCIIRYIGLHGLVDEVPLVLLSELNILCSIPTGNENGLKKLIQPRLGCVKAVSGLQSDDGSYGFSL